MYYVVNAKDRVRVPPQFFSMKLADAMTQILRDKYERRIDREAGLVLAIWNAKPSGEGIVIPGDGAAYYDVNFEMLTYAPQINEVIEAEVTEIVEFGAFLGLGPLEGLVHLSQIANDFLTYNKKTASFTGRESKKAIKKGDMVLAKISTVSLKNTINETKIGLTMRPEGLGKEEWVEATERRKDARDGKEAKEAKEEKPEKKEKKKKEEKKE